MDCPLVMLWIFDQGDGLLRVCIDTNLTVNAKSPDYVFNPKAKPSGATNPITNN